MKLHSSLNSLKCIQRLAEASCVGRSRRPGRDLLGDGGLHLAHRAVAVELDKSAAFAVHDEDA